MQRYLLNKPKNLMHTYMGENPNEYCGTYFWVKYMYLNKFTWKNMNSIQMEFWIEFWWILNFLLSLLPSQIYVKMERTDLAAGAGTAYIL